MKKISLWITTAALLLTLLTTLTVSVCAEDAVYEGFCGNDLAWRLYTDTGELVIAGNGDMPAYESTSDNAPWYAYRQDIRSLTVMNGVTSIGDYAFFNCSNLTDIYLPNSLVSIGANAFSGCRALLTLDIPNGVLSIGNYALSGCTSLESVSLPAEMTVIPDALFSGCVKLKSVTLPEGLTAIGNNAFFGCRVLTDPIIPEGVTSIGDGAFYSCKEMTTIQIPVGVTSIGSDAFRMCSNLKTVSLPNTLTEIGSHAFDGTAPELVLYYGTEAEWQQVSRRGKQHSVDRGTGAPPRPRLHLRDPRSDLPAIRGRLRARRDLL